MLEPAKRVELLTSGLRNHRDYAQERLTLRARQFYIMSLFFKYVHYVQRSPLAIWLAILWTTVPFLSDNLTQKLARFLGMSPILLL
jgi:hypothetical protein